MQTGFAKTAFSIRSIPELRSTPFRAANDIWVHAIDLKGYGTQQFHGQKTNIMAGWSEKVLQFIQLAESGVDSLQEAIEHYEW